MIRWTYDPDADAMHISLEGIPCAGRCMTTEVAHGVLADFDEKNRLQGIEILRASRHYPAKWLVQADRPVTWLSISEAVAESEAEGERIEAAEFRRLLKLGALDNLKIEGVKVGRTWLIGLHTVWNILSYREWVRENQ